MKKCPVCKKKIYTKKYDRDTDTLHLWFCSSCKFIWFEFVNNKQKVQNLLIPIKTDEDLEKENKKKVENEGIKKLLSIFNDYNKSVGYANKGHRKVLADMLKVMSLEKAIEYVEYVISIQGEEFAPLISTPMELKYKQDKVQRYIETH